MSYANELCGSKLRAKLGASLNESAAQGICSTSFAARQMAKMGWKEGTGLGKNRDGMKTHIKVVKREDNVGLGQEKELANEMSKTWWKDNVSSTLERLQNNNTKKKKKKKKKDSKKKKDYTDEELFEATGGARFGMRAQRRAEGKWKRAEIISTEDEDQAKSKIEWNGLGKAKTLLSDHLVSADSSEIGSSSSDVEKDITSISKKRKRNTDENSISADKINKEGTSSQKIESKIQTEDTDNITEKKKKKSKKKAKTKKAKKSKLTHDNEQGGSKQKKKAKANKL